MKASATLPVEDAGGSGGADRSRVPSEGGRERPVSARRSGPAIGIVGIGYMGIATGLAFAHRGRRVAGFDIRPGVRAAVRRGASPYAEPRLPELLRAETRSGRFRAVDSIEEVAASSDCIFLCVATPPARSGAVDLRPLRAAAAALGSALRGVRGYRVVVVKSTVVPGVTTEVVEPILRRGSGKGPAELGVAVNPEFLSEGRMIADALEPARIVLGVSDRRAERVVRRAYAGFRAPVITLSPSEAELVKHGSNEFLALKVSYANELSRWTERLGGDVDRVAAAIGADPRIGPQFLRAGPGFGGSCFAKDLRAFGHRGSELGVGAELPRATLAINAEQTRHAIELIRRAVGRLRGRQVALLGLAFKVGTDDVRESRALPIAEALVLEGARVRAHDPQARTTFAREWVHQPPSIRRRLRVVRSPSAAVRGADVAVLQAEWPEYLVWPTEWTRVMRRPLLVDLRRGVPDRVARRAGLTVLALGRGLTTGTSPPRPVRPRKGEAP